MNNKRKYYGFEAWGSSGTTYAFESRADLDRWVEVADHKRKSVTKKELRKLYQDRTDAEFEEMMRNF